MNKRSPAESDPDILVTAMTGWLSSRLSERNYSSLEALLSRVEKSREEWEIYSMFSRSTRAFGKKGLQLTGQEKQQAESLRADWKPDLWRTDQLVRTLFLLVLSKRDKQEWLNLLKNLFETGDIEESIALYQSLPVLPWPEDFVQRTAEGIRTNITSVFEAIALDNPYPADFLDEAAWNQMVLKALFVGSPLYRIQGLDRRTNQTLGQMLIDYAQERKSAGRPVPVELWRPLSPHLSPAHSDDLKRAIDQDELSRLAIRRAISDSQNSELKALLEPAFKQYSTPQQQLPDWDEIGKRADQNR